MNPTLSFYFTLLLRRAHWIVLIFGVFTAASLTVARILPPVYEARTQMLIEPPQIPTNLAASTVQTNPVQEMQIIEQRLMTRVNLTEIARTEGAFRDIGTMSPDDVVQGMRSATRIRRSTGRGQANLMTIIFESDRAQVAASVVNRYVTIVLQDNVESRTDRAGKTLEFFEVEVERLGYELERRSAEILTFNNDNSDALPTTLPFRLGQQGAVQARIAVLERDINNLVDQRARLVEIFQTTGTLSTVVAIPRTAEQQKLAQLEQQLSDALVIYSSENPKVKLLKAQVARQTEIVSEQAGLSQQNTQGSTMSILDVQLADMDARVAVFQADLEIGRVALDAVVETIRRTPAVQIQLDALNRDYANIQQQYNTAVNGLAKAATGERIELLSKGQRITVIDPATVPSSPARPDRKMIAAGGSLTGLALGFALILGIELLNNSIRRPIEISQRLGITPLAALPYLRTPMELVARRASMMGVFLAVVIGIPAVLFAIHTYYLPLDLIYERIAGRIGRIL